MEPAHRERLEARLVDELPVVREYCRAFGHPVHSWPDHPGLQCFVDLALRRAVDDALSGLRARSETHALQLVAPRMGQNPRTVRSRWYRYRRAG